MSDSINTSPPDQLAKIQASLDLLISLLSTALTKLDDQTALLQQLASGLTSPQS